MKQSKPLILIARNSDFCDKFKGLDFVIRKAVNQTLNYVPAKGITEKTELSVALIDNNHMQEINSSYRDKNKPTNVLSFPFAEFKSGEYLRSENIEVLGEIIISLEKLLQEADEQGKKPEDHLYHLVIHSVLHLLGFDHENDREAEEMEKLEVEILSKEGIKTRIL
jgi:probable rRNA maturation factor